MSCLFRCCCPSDNDNDTLRHNIHDKQGLLSTTELRPIITQSKRVHETDSAAVQDDEDSGNGRPSLNRSDSDKYYVKWDFRGLQKGLQVEQIDENADVDNPWISVRDSEGNIHKAPLVYLAKIRDIKEEPWYFMNINDRDHATLVLQNADHEDGLYLIRKCSSDESPYVLSVKRIKNDKTKECHVEHFQISEKNGLFGELGEENFVTLAALIDSYIESGFLSKPCPKEQIINIAGSEIEMGDEIGSGAFGVVCKGVWCNRTVAIKHILRKADFTAEIKQVCQFNHPQIVTMYGANISSPPHFMVMEYMCNDTLKTYVHNNELTLQEQLFIMEQIADGMRFLEKYKVLHRDLAARNVLIGENLCAKIADFGLSRNLPPDDDYYKSGANKLPVLWLAVESLEDHKFTVKSDVWMFGILTMEVFKRGEKPYAEFKLKREDIIVRVCQGMRMSQPENMPKDVYNVVRKCWSRDPAQRPSFKELYQYLMERKQENKNDVY